MNSFPSARFASSWKWLARRVNIAGSRQIQLGRWALVAASNILPWPLFVGWRARLLRAAGARIGSGARIFGHLVIANPEFLTVGAGVFINVRCTFEGTGMIMIGDGTFIGPGVQIATTHHAPNNMALEAHSVSIGMSCWIGAGALLMPGCILESGTTVAAGTVMLGRSYSAGVYAGVPGRLIRAADRVLPMQ